MLMADRQRRIPPALKRQLVDETGGKCANPGCANWRSHIHHIKHWAVYKAHESSDMIAVCPSCHDACHCGALQITDQSLYLWKGVERSRAPDTAHIYVEPAHALKLLTGSIAISSTNTEATVFELSNANRLRFRVLDGDLLQVSARLSDQKGKEVLRVVDNHVRVVRDAKVRFDFRAGRARITVPATEGYIPEWVLTQMRAEEPDFGLSGELVALDLEVLKPGLLRVQGFWPAEASAVVINQERLSFCRKGAPRPLSLIGEGENSVLLYAGPITTSLFGLA
jgi:hypothetical protein